MVIVEVWDVVKVQFPHMDRPVRQRRPALVIAADEIKAAHRLIWLIMITSAVNRIWPDDARISDLRAAGLPAPSIVRPQRSPQWTPETRSSSVHRPLPIVKPSHPDSAES
jgi:hypothetical protein